MNEFVKILLIILLSSVKFVAGPPFAYFDKRYDFSFFETVLYCVIGGMLGVWFFTFFSLEIQIMLNWVRRQFRRTLKHRSAEGKLKISYKIPDSERHTQKVFTPHSRKFVRLWKKYGMIGIAFLTPVIISIPIGTIILNAFEDNKTKIFMYMFFSIVFWSVMFTSILELLHVVNIHELKQRITG